MGGGGVGGGYWVVVWVGQSEKNESQTQKAREFSSQF